MIQTTIVRTVSEELGEDKAHTHRHGGGVPDVISQVEIIPHQPSSLH